MDEYINKVLHSDPVRKAGVEIEMGSEEHAVLDLLRFYPEDRLPVNTLVGDPEASGNKRAAAKKLKALAKLRELELIEESDGSVSFASDVEVPWPVPDGGPSFEELRERFRQKGGTGQGISQATRHRPRRSSCPSS